jgi:hypothetical protein
MDQAKTVAELMGIANRFKDGKDVVGGMNPGRVKRLERDTIRN